MKRSIWNIKIPTYAGLLLLVFIAGITILLTQSETLTNIRANPSSTPAFVRITNVTDTSFSVSYITAESTTGSISYGETSSVGTVVADDRDQNGTPQPHELHYFSIKNLKPKTQYYFTILSGDKTYMDQNRPYMVTTGATLTGVGNQKIAKGKILLPDGNYPKEAVAYIQIASSQTLSTLVQLDGSYTFPLNLLRTNTLEQYTQLTENDQVTLTFIGDGYQATAATSVKDILQIPPVTLSNHYSFTADKGTSPTQAVSSSTTPGLLPKGGTSTSDDEIQILIPEKNQSFTDQQPKFSGRALPNSSVDIVIQSSTDIKTTVKATADGTWSFRPSQPLDPGIHSITISSRDSKGLLQTITETFVVYAAGSQFTDPSVSPEKPTPTEIISPTQPAATLTPTTSSPSATPDITLVVSPTFEVPSPTLFITSTVLSPQPTIAAPGSNELLITLGFVLFATFASALVFFLIHV